jgi:CRP-like cAMP-binding protein
MFEQSGTHQHSDTRAVSGARQLVGRHAPTQNHLLAALPLVDYERLLRELEPVVLPLGQIIDESGDREKYLYFPTAGIVCRFYGMASGASAGIAVTGREGVVGVASFLGGKSTPSQAEVVGAGFAYRIRAALLKSAFEHDGPLPQLLLRYTQMLFNQIGQLAACNRHHSLEQRLCRLLLSCLDRVPLSSVTMTHGRLADILGVRREGVTQAVGALQKAGLIRSSRGQITVLDRSRLEALTCECYGVVRRERDRLLADYRRGEDACRDPEITRVRRLPGLPDTRERPHHATCIATFDCAKTI